MHCRKGDESQGPTEHVRTVDEVRREGRKKESSWDKTREQGEPGSPVCTGSRDSGGGLAAN